MKHAQTSEQINAIRMVVRTKKQDSAILYHLLEAHEGLTAYSTLDFRTADPHRDVELLISPDFVADVKILLEEWKDWVEVMPEKNL
jgi:hypothetical protein